MSDDASTPPAADPGSSRERRPLLRVWFGVRDEVSQGMYAASGIVLMLLKYAVEAGVIVY